MKIHIDEEEMKIYQWERKRCSNCLVELNDYQQFYSLVEKLLTPYYYELFKKQNNKTFFVCEQRRIYLPKPDMK